MKIEFVGYSGSLMIAREAIYSLNGEAGRYLSTSCRHVYLFEKQEVVLKVEEWRDYGYDDEYDQTSMGAEFLQAVETDDMKYFADILQYGSCFDDVVNFKEYSPSLDNLTDIFYSIQEYYPAIHPSMASCESNIKANKIAGLYQIGDWSSGQWGEYLGEPVIWDFGFGSSGSYSYTYCYACKETHNA